ncbi:MAG: tetratricopeptide repeat protein [Caldilineaceae bacterium]
MGGGQLLNNLANVTRRLRDFDAAQAMYAESLRINRQLGDRWALAYLLEDMGVLAAQMDLPVRALCLVGAAATARRHRRARPRPRRRSSIRRCSRSSPGSTGHRRRTVGPGRGLALDEIVACALGERPSPMPLTSTPSRKS